MSIWDPERARKRKVQLDRQRLTRELDAADERQDRLAHAAKTAWFSAAFMNLSSLISALTSTAHVGVSLSFGAGALCSAMYISDLAGDREPPRWVRWAISTYGIVAAVVVVWQVATRGRL